MQLVQGAGKSRLAIIKTQAKFIIERAGGATLAAHPDWVRLYQYLLVIALATAALWLLAGEFGRKAVLKDQERRVS